MYYDRKKYESLIQSSLLFTLNKETEKAAYKREAYTMIEYLYCYLLTSNKQKYEPYGCEIMEVATRCINNYESSKGVFLHYFNASWKQEYSHICGDQINEKKFRGMKITEEDKRNIRKYLRLNETLGVSSTNEDIYEKISEAMNLPVDKVRLIAQIADIYVGGNLKTNADGEEIDVWEQISDGVSFEQQLEAADSVDDLLFKIEQAFTSLQNRQKPIVSDMITIRIWPVLINQHDAKKKFTFISYEILQEYLSSGTVPSQRNIAQKYSRDEASISRTIKQFLNKLKIHISEE
jgi:hypothetical protein